jgi:hypothetical protein
MVVHSYNPSFSGGGGRKISVQVWPGQKHETLSEKKKSKSKRTGANARPISSTGTKKKKERKMWSLNV